jgi:tape measure domain-containing protein
MALGDLVVKLGMNSQNFNRGLLKARGGLKGFDRGVASVSRRSQSLNQGLRKASGGLRGFGHSVGGLTRRMIGLGAATLGIGTALGAMTFGIKLAAQAEQTKIAFTTLLGSASAARDMMTKLEQFAASTPFQFTDLTDVAKKMIGMKVSAEGVIPRLIAIGDAVSSVGGGAVEMKSVNRALGQMSAKGKVSAEEMNQLAENNIFAWDMLAEKMGIDVPAAMKLASAGAIDAATAVPQILEAMGERATGAMDAQSRTILGRWSTLKDNVFKIMRDVGAGFLDNFSVGEKLEGTIAWAKDLGKWIGEAGTFIKNDLVPGFRLAGNAIGMFVIEGVERFKWMFVDVIPGLWDQLSSNFKNMLTNMAGMVDAFVETAGIKFSAFLFGGFKEREAARNLKFADALNVGKGNTAITIPEFQPSEMLKSMQDIRDSINAERDRLRSKEFGLNPTGLAVGTGFQRKGSSASAGAPILSGRGGPAGFAEAGTAKAYSAIQASLRGARDPILEEAKKQNVKADTQIDLLGDIIKGILEQVPGVVIG